jgi:RNA polymerase sigma-70 factor (sigma-E family)
MADRSGFEAYAQRDTPRLLRAAYALTRDAHLAEDLVQSALTKAWLAWPRIDGDPEPYVLRVLTTTNASWWRRRSSREVPVEPRADETAPGPSSAPTDGDTSLDLWDALGRLPQRQRAVVVLRYVLDLPENRTADVLGCSVGTVKSQASKGLAKLRLDPSLAPVQEVWT